MQVDIGQFLASKKLRVTDARKIIFGLLLTSSEPLSMGEIVEAVHGKLDRSSVYRVIGLFEKIGVTRRVNTGWKYKIELSESFAVHHHHFICLQCHKIIRIDESEVSELIDKLSSEKKFHVVEHHFELHGICRDCLSRKSD